MSLTLGSAFMTLYLISCVGLVVAAYHAQAWTLGVAAVLIAFSLSSDGDSRGSEILSGVQLGFGIAVLVAFIIGKWFKEGL